MPRKFKLPNDQTVMPTAADLMGVSIRETGGALVSLHEKLPCVKAEYLKQDMLPYTGEDILVRDWLVPLLREAHELMQLHAPGHNFLIRYGYRHPEVQEQYFKARFEANAEANPLMDGSELIELTHTQVAYPQVAGHPTGGAVDITLIGPDGNELDMGTGIADYSEPEKCHYYCEEVTLRQWKNRKLLRVVMTDVGFAPFNGEWWHFSYGDREWAFFYNQPSSLFMPIDFRNND